MRPLLPPEALWLRTDELNAELKRWPRMQLKTDSLADKAANTNLAFRTLPDWPSGRSRNPRWIICASSRSPLPARWCSPLSEGRREALGELLGRIKVAPKRILRLSEATGNGRYLMIGAAEHGFIDTLNNLALICESDLLGERVARRRQDSRRTINPDTLIRNRRAASGPADCAPEHGVGRYQGMTTLEAGGIKGEYLMLTYANDAKLYVPVSSLHLISRYAGGAEENAPLHKLGGDARARARRPRKSARRGRRAAGYLRPARGQRGLRL